MKKVHYRPSIDKIPLKVLNRGDVRCMFCLRCSTDTEDHTERKVLQVYPLIKVKRYWFRVPPQ